MTESHLRLTPKETNILGLKRKLELAKGIIEKGGRPSIVRAACQISKPSALQLHKEIHGRGPTAGLLPYDPDWIVKSPQNCLHASIYFNIYQKISSIAVQKSIRDQKSSSSISFINNETPIPLNDATKGEVYLASYSLYEQVIGNEPKILNINRAWHIGQQIAMSHIGGTTCARCHSVFVSINDFPDLYKFCPICDSFTDCTGRQKWKSLTIKSNGKGTRNNVFSKYVFHSEAL